MHKISKTIMHVWISAVSLGAFVFSWVLLAHSPKPSTLSALVAPTPQIIQVPVPDQPGLEPIPSLNDYLKPGSSQAQTQNKSTITVQPRLRTRGS
jgi:hypothetical protein